MARFTGLLGLLTMLALAYLFSTNRRAIRLKTVAWGLGLQITFAFLVFYWTFGQQLFFRAGNAVNRLLAYAFVGSEFVFGELGKQHSSIGFIFAFQVLPTIIFIASLVLIETMVKPVPSTARILVDFLMATAFAAAIAFLGGSAYAEGKIPFFKGHEPIKFATNGGVAVFVIVLGLCVWVYH